MQRVFRYDSDSATKFYFIIILNVVVGALVFSAALVARSYAFLSIRGLLLLLIYPGAFAVGLIVCKINWRPILVDEKGISRLAFNKPVETFYWEDINRIDEIIPALNRKPRISSYRIIKGDKKIIFDNYIGSVNSLVELLQNKIDQHGISTYKIVEKSQPKLVERLNS